MLRLPLLRLFERIAAVLRRVGLGAMVDRARGTALRRLGDFTDTVDGVTLSGDVALHSHYVRALQEAQREHSTVRVFVEAVREGAGGSVQPVGAGNR